MAWAVQFDGVSGYLPVTLNEAVSSASFALNFTFSVSPEARDWTDAISIVFGSTHIVWEISGSNRALNVYRVLGSNGSGQAPGAYAIDDGVHRNAVINADSGVLSIYIDGALYATSTWIGGVDISHLTVSSRYAAYESRACQTQFQFFDIYDGLSLADAQALSSGSAITPQPRLNLSANASDHSSTTLTDTIGGNDSTFVNMDVEAWITTTEAPITTVEALAPSTFDVRGTVESAIANTFDLRDTVQTDLTGLFNIHGTVSSTETVLFDVYDSVSSTETGLFDLHDTLTVQTISVFDIAEGISAGTLTSTVTSSFNVRDTLLADAGSSFDLRATLDTAQPSTFDLRIALETTLDSIFDVLGLVRRDLTSSYDIRGSVQTEAPWSYDILGTIKTPHVSLFDLLGTLVSTKRSIYPIEFGTVYETVRSFHASRVIIRDSVLSTTDSSIHFAGTEADSSFTFTFERTAHTFTFERTAHTFTFERGTLTFTF